MRDRYKERVKYALSQEDRRAAEILQRMKLWEPRSGNFYDPEGDEVFWKPGDTLPEEFDQLHANKVVV